MARVLTLYYHRVNELDNDYNLLAVSKERFKQQMLWLKNNYSIVDSRDDWENLDGNHICITFDDGYKDNYLNAVPILQECGIPATIFVSTATLKNNKIMWWDELEQIMLCSNVQYPNSFELKDDEFSTVWETSNMELRENCYKALHYLMKNYINYSRRESWMQQLYQWRNMPVLTGNMLNEEECVSLSHYDNIAIGAHTVTHPSLASCTLDEQRKEITESIDVIENIIKQKVEVFSYPFGVYGIDYTKETISCFNGTSVKKAFSTDNGLWKNNDSLLNIPRKVVRNWDVYTFESMINEYWK